MKYLPDTNVWISFLNPGDHPVKQTMAGVPTEQIVTCSVVKAELYFGAERSARKAENRALLDQLFAQIPSLPFDDVAALEYASIRAHLASRGTPIGPNDLMIAAIAKANDMIVVTHNTMEFARVSDLKIEDWEVDSPHEETDSGPGV